MSESNERRLREANKNLHLRLDSKQRLIDSILLALFPDEGEYSRQQKEDLLPGVIVEMKSRVQHFHEDQGKINRQTFLIQEENARLWHMVRALTNDRTLLATFEDRIVPNPFNGHPGMDGMSGSGSVNAKSLR